MAKNTMEMVQRLLKVPLDHSLDQLGGHHEDGSPVGAVGVGVPHLLKHISYAQALLVGHCFPSWTRPCSLQQQSPW